MDGGGQFGNQLSPVLLIPLLLQSHFCQLPLQLLDLALRSFLPLVQSLALCLRQLLTSRSFQLQLLDDSEILPALSERYNTLQIMDITSNGVPSGKQGIAGEILSLLWWAVVSRL